MAPLPLFHRPLSQDNSRETSLSSGRGGGRSTGPDTSGSGSGVSLPMRGQTNAKGQQTPNTPDTPSTVITSSMPNAASSDYLIPLTGNIRPKNIKTHHRQSVTSHTTGTPVSSPSDEPASEESDGGSNPDEEETSSALLPTSVSKTIVYDNEAETSFSCSPTRTSYSNVRSSNVSNNGPHVKRKTSGAKIFPG